MPSKAEKQKRKELLNAMAKKGKDDFEKNLPMKREIFSGLFDFLDQKLSENDCDHTNKLTKEYLEKVGQKDIDTILNWLANNGGYCDCEILENVEELFENHIRNAFL
jgi:hypothetical protein